MMIFSNYQLFFQGAISISLARIPDANFMPTTIRQKSKATIGFKKNKNCKNGANKTMGNLLFNGNVNGTKKQFDIAQLTSSLEFCDRSKIIRLNTLQIWCKMMSCSDL